MKAVFFVIVGAFLLNTAAFAQVGPTQDKCKDIADKVKRAKAAAAASSGASPAATAPTGASGQ